MKNWMVTVALLVFAAASVAALAQVVSRSLVEQQEAYDLDTGESYGRVQVSGTVRLPPGRQGARIGFRPTQYRPGLLSSARTELRLDLSCEEANREVLDAAATLAYLWQVGTPEQILDAIGAFPEKKTGCTVSIHPSRWTAHP